MEILDNVPFELNTDSLLSCLHIDKESEDAKDIQHLVETVSPVASPKAIYKVFYI
jgi:hypothetical protein